jgi:hypothetical protein
MLGDGFVLASTSPHLEAWVATSRGESERHDATCCGEGAGML